MTAHTAVAIVPARTPAISRSSTSMGPPARSSIGKRRRLVTTWETAPMIERQVDITTPDGEMTTFIFHPERGGPFPVVLYLMDAPSIRPALKDMASRLASAGYYVLLPYLFYR